MSLDVFFFLLWLVLLKRRSECAEDPPDDTSRTETDINVANRQEESSARGPIIIWRVEEPDLELRELLKEAFSSFQQQNYAKAISLYTRVIIESLFHQNKKPVAQYYSLRGGCHWRNGNSADAESDLRKSLSLSPHESVRVQLTAILFQAGKFDNAIEEVILTDNAIEIARLGDKFAELMKFDRAFTCYSEAIKRNSKELAYYRKRAKCSCHLRNFGSAVSDYREILSVNRGSLTDRKALVDALFAANELKEAIQETFRTDTSKFEDLANKFVLLGKFGEASFCYTEAIKREPENKGYYLKRGKVYLKDQNLVKAIDDFRTVLTSHPDLTYARKLLIKALLDFHEIHQATKEMSALSDDELYYLAYEMFIEGKSEKALRCCTKAIEKSDAKEKYFRLRGNCYKRLGDNKSAIQDFRTVIRISPEPPTVGFLLDYGELLLDEGRYSEVKKILNPLGKKNLTEDEAVNLLNIFERMTKMERERPEKMPTEAEIRDSEAPNTSLVPPYTTLIRDNDATREEEQTPQPSIAERDVELLRATSQPASQPSTSVAALGRKRKERNETYPSELHLALRNLMDAPPREDSQDRPHDKFDMLAKMWINDLKSVTDPQQLLYAKKAISDVLFEAQLGTLRKNSVVIKPRLDKSIDAEND